MLRPLTSSEGSTVSSPAPPRTTGVMNIWLLERSERLSSTKSALMLREPSAVATDTFSAATRVARSSAAALPAVAVQARRAIAV